MYNKELLITNTSVMMKNMSNICISDIRYNKGRLTWKSVNVFVNNQYLL